jgi:hypothetical protein
MRTRSADGQTMTRRTDRHLVDRQTLGRRTDAVYGQTFKTDAVYGQTFVPDRRDLWTDLWQRTDAVYGQTFAQQTDRGTLDLIDREIHQEVDLTMAMAELAMASHP